LRPIINYQFNNQTRAALQFRKRGCLGGSRNAAGIIQEKNMITISRPINGITLNGDEFLLDGDGNVVEFMSHIEAYMFLQGKGLTTEEIDALTFHDSDDEQLAVN
jgi:hypothetical protein